MSKLSIRIFSAHDSSVDENVLKKIEAASIGVWVIDSEICKTDVLSSLYKSSSANDDCAEVGKSVPLELSVFVVKRPLENAVFRVEKRVLENDDKIVLFVSTWGLEEADLTVLLVAAVFAFFIRAEHSERRICALSLLRASRSVDQEICDGCKHSLIDIIPECYQILDRVLLFNMGHDPDRHIVLVHGIRTFASWMDKVGGEFSKLGGNPTLFHYGVFSSFKLLVHKMLGRKIERQFSDSIKSILRKNPYAKISVIAHSYGTLVVCNSLKNQKELVLDSVVLCAGIVPRDFPFHQLIEDGRLKRVLCEIGDKDLIPLLSAKFLPGAGGSGFEFMGVCDSKVKSVRYQNCGHSTLLTKEHALRVWLPYIIAESPVLDFPTGVEPSLRVKLALHIRKLLLILFLLGVFQWMNY